MSKEFSPTLDEQMKAGVLEDELNTIHERHNRRSEADEENRSAFKRRIRKVLAITAGVGALGFLGNETLNNFNTQQELKNDVPGQQYLQQGLEDGSIDRSQAAYLHKD